MDTSFKDLLVRAIPNLRAFAMSLCRDATRADDLVQETMLKAWTHSGTFVEGTNLKAWLFTILRNTYFSELRRVGYKADTAHVDGDEVVELPSRPEQHGAADLTDLKYALAKISPEQREAVELVCVLGMTYEEAAQIAGCEIGTVKSRVNRGRVRLAQILQLDVALEELPDP